MHAIPASAKHSAAVGAWPEDILLDLPASFVTSARRRWTAEPISARDETSVEAAEKSSVNTEEKLALIISDAPCPVAELQPQEEETEEKSNEVPPQTDSLSPAFLDSVRAIFGYHVQTPVHVLEHAAAHGRRPSDAVWNSSEHEHY